MNVELVVGGSLGSLLRRLAGRPRWTCIICGEGIYDRAPFGFGPDRAWRIESENYDYGWAHMTCPVPDRLSPEQMSRLRRAPMV